MKLFTKQQKEKLIKNYIHHKEYWNDEHPKYKEFKAVLKLFNPTGIGTWYLMNMHKDNDYCWGICHIYEWEIGSFSINELKGVNLPFGLKIERDKFFKPVKASELWTKLTKEGN